MNEANQTLIVPEERKPQLAQTSKLPRNATPMQMIQAAVQQGATTEYIKELMDLHDRYEKNEARKQYNEAVAAFKANPPRVVKDKTNKQYGSSYTSIGNLVNTVNSELSKYGLSARWDQDQESVPGQIKVTCILSHASGYSEESSMIAPPDTSGQKNPIQQIKSTMTYLRIATFESVTGIASEEGALDDDGNAAGAEPPKIKTISPEQVESLEALITELGIDKAAYLKAGHLEKLEDLPANKFQNAIKILEKRRQGLGAK